MCAPSTPKYTAPKEQPEIATPTIADATVTKASDKTRIKAKKNSMQDVKTSARGLGEEAQTIKKSLLGE